MNIRVCFARQFRHAQVKFHQPVAQAGLVHGIQGKPVITHAKFLEVRHPGAQPGNMGLGIGFRLLAARAFECALVAAEQDRAVRRVLLDIGVMIGEIRSAGQFALLVVFGAGVEQAYKDIGAVVHLVRQGRFRVVFEHRRMHIAPVAQGEGLRFRQLWCPYRQLNIRANGYRFDVEAAQLYAAGPFARRQAFGGNVQPQLACIPGAYLYKVCTI
ncbi:MAG: hypothetical protein BWX80_03904 [Candidatus Hydrogenedentes bacterium ADurb.Bin101]|nr:MAG: hypothetical protein BWX80_03904 [Candidatus Hydrogenedentes bacterium ADurb.Bin101]